MSDVRPIAQLTEESEHNLDALRRGLRRAGTFAFYVVLAGDAARGEVLRRLRAWSGVGGVPELFFFPNGIEAAAKVDQFLAASDRKNPLSGAVVPHGEVLLDENAGAVIAALNRARDDLWRQIRGPLVMVIPASRVGELSREASDLWDVRAATVAVESVQVKVGAIELAQSAASTVEGKQRRTRAEMLAEAARLRALAESKEFPAGALVDAWVRLALELFNANERGEARQATEDAELLAEQIGYKAGLGDALSVRAQVFEREGRVLEWENVLRRALALHREAGRRDVAAADSYWLGVALIQAGKLDEAEKTLREAMQDYEELGEVRRRAIALGRIADILQARGELDEALHILQQEAMPALEKHGAARDLLICRAKLARIYLARNAPGDRDTAAHLLQLAHAAAVSMGLPEADRIRRIQQDHGLPL